MEKKIYRPDGTLDFVLVFNKPNFLFGRNKIKLVKLIKYCQSFEMVDYIVDYNEETGETIRTLFFNENFELIKIINKNGIFEKIQ